MGEPGTYCYVWLAVLCVCALLLPVGRAAFAARVKFRARAWIEAGKPGAKTLATLEKGAGIAAKFAAFAFSLATASLAMYMSVLLHINEKTGKGVAVFVTAATLVSVAEAVQAVGGKWLQKVFGRGKQAVPTVTESEIKALVNAGHEEGVIEVDERRMIHNVFEFGDSFAKDVMVPRTDIVAVSCDSTVAQALAVIEKERFSRLPIYREDIDNIEGWLYLKDIVFLDEESRKKTVGGYLRTPYFSYELKPTDELFAEMRKERASLAVILDEYGGTAGIVTLEDLVEEIVGEMADEYDDETDEEVVKISKGEYLVDAAAKLDDFNEIVGTSFTSEDYETVGGYVLGLFDRIPELGDEITAPAEEAKNDVLVTFTIEAVGKNRLERLRAVIKDTKE